MRSLFAFVLEYHIFLFTIMVCKFNILLSRSIALLCSFSTASSVCCCRLSQTNWKEFAPFIQTVFTDSPNKIGVFWDPLPTVVERTLKDYQVMLIIFNFIIHRMCVILVLHLTTCFTVDTTQ